MKKLAISLVAAMLLFAAVRSPVTFAAVIEVSNTVQKAFDKTALSADVLLRNKLQGQLAEFVSSQERIRQWDSDLKSLRYKNEEARTAVLQRIKKIGVDKLNKLEAAAKQARERYKSLNELYKTLRSESMRVAVQLARFDMQAKEVEWDEAKDGVKKTVAKIRGTLAGIDTVNVKIKSVRNDAKLLTDRLSTEWKNFTLIVKKTDAKATSGSLEMLNTQAAQIVSKKKAIAELENKISSIIETAKGQIP